MSRSSRKSVVVPSDALLPIVGNASIAGQVLEGVNVPLLIVDTTKHAFLREFIRIQQQGGQGDVRSAWGVLAGQDDVVLLDLVFIAPVEGHAVLRFSIEHEGILVDAAVRSRAIYLQEGTEGDRLVHDPAKPKILVGVTTDTFAEEWDEIFVTRMAKVLRREGKFGRAQARAAAAEFILQLRTVTTFRMPQG